MENNKEKKSVADIIGEVVEEVNDPKKGSDVSRYYNEKGSGGYTGD